MNTFSKDRLYAENEDLRERIAELEKEKNNAFLSNWEIFLTTDLAKKQLAIRDLEQQAKGMEDLIKEFLSRSGMPVPAHAVTIGYICKIIDELRKQVRQLKDGDL